MREVVNNHSIAKIKVEDIDPEKIQCAVSVDDEVFILKNNEGVFYFDCPLYYKARFHTYEPELTIQSALNSGWTVMEFDCVKDYLNWAITIEDRQILKKQNANN